MLKLKFELNEMQQESLALRGKNIMLNAPTGSGKTEAFLLNLKSREISTLLLPTITSCVFMYQRLVADFDNINIIIKTSLLTDKRMVPNAEFSIEIMCPDGPLTDYLDTKRSGGKSGESNPFSGNCLILDEIDNYPVMVKTALIEFLKDFPDLHVIVASATIDNELGSIFKGLGIIEIVYNQDIKLIKHKTGHIKHLHQIRDVVMSNRDKKIGIICNTINEMYSVAGFLESESYIFHHAQLTEYERLENEKKLFFGNFRLVISNDLISFSVDIDFDILIMSLSDKLSINLQRIGRNNRYNKMVFYKNLYIIDPNIFPAPPFINEYAQYDQLKYFPDFLSYERIRQIRSELEPETLPDLEHIYKYWDTLEQKGLELNLREVPITLELDTKIDIWEYNELTRKKEKKTIDTKLLIKINDELPYAYSYSESGGYLYSSEKNAKSDNRTLLYLKGKRYEILETLPNGRFKIAEYNGEFYVKCPNCSKGIPIGGFFTNSNTCIYCSKRPHRKRRRHY